MRIQLTFDYFYNKVLEDNKSINKLYDLILANGARTFTSFLEYDRAMQFLIEKYISFRDFLHSNNLMQAYRNEVSRQMKREFPNWFLYNSLLIYSKRTIKHFLDNPMKFWGTVDILVKRSLDENNSDYKEKLNHLIISTLDYYKSELVAFPEYLNESLKNFIYYYKNVYKKSFSPECDNHIKELEKLINAGPIEIRVMYQNLESQNLEIESENSNLLVNPVTIDALGRFSEEDRKKIIEKFYQGVIDFEALKNFYGDISLTEEDERKRIVIIGDGKFIKNRDKVYAIAKKFGINKEQLEIYSDYNKITNEGKKIADKIQWNDKYIGVIFGANPHSTSGNRGFNSLFSYMTQNDGFPTIVECSANNNDGSPKITKKSYVNALVEIITSYKSE